MRTLQNILEGLMDGMDTELYINPWAEQLDLYKCNSGNNRKIGNELSDYFRNLYTNTKLMKTLADKVQIKDIQNNTQPDKYDGFYTWFSRDSAYLVDLRYVYDGEALQYFDIWFSPLGCNTIIDDVSYSIDNIFTFNGNKYVWKLKPKVRDEIIEVLKKYHFVR